jgi:phosphate transport system permease protein
LREGLPTLGEVEPGQPVQHPLVSHRIVLRHLPLISGSLIVTVGAALVAIPFGIGTAIFIAEIAPRWAREILKPLVELLGGLPSVVLGFLGILVLAPNLRILLDLPTGLTALAGSLLLGAIAIPTVVSVAEDALDSVPRSYRDAALALGATRWQTIWRVTLPAARSGVLTGSCSGSDAPSAKP